MRPSLSPLSSPFRSLATALQSATDDYTSFPDVDLAAYLSYFEPASPGSFRLPPSARVNPSLRQVEWQPLGFFGLWKYVAFIVLKVFTLFYDFLLHVLCGPRRQSWGWEMTFLTSLMRDASRYSHLMDVSMLRSILGLLGFAPVPSSTVVTPVTYRVRKRRLRGFLGECGFTEDGTRQISGEWVVDKAVWRKFQAEWKTRKDVKTALSSDQVGSVKSRVILFIHGGAYCLFSAATHRQLAKQLSSYTGCRVFSVDYRLAPETRFPGQIVDVFASYMRLVEELRIPPESIILAGDSAGGGLSLALLFYLRDNGYTLPAGAILLSPWVDLTMSCDSWDTNAAFDIVPMPKPADHMDPIANYLGPEIGKFINHPYASPLFGDFRGLPPLLIQAGDSEVLRDESRLLALKASAAGVLVKYELYKDAVHVFQNFPFLEESKKAFRACGSFVRGFSSSNPPSLNDD